MSTKPVSSTTHESSFMPYIVGFILSLVLTFAGYLLVTNHLLNNSVLILLLLTLAFVQLIVQLLFFLHLGREKKPHWQLIFLITTLSGILLLVGGSIWIMQHLNYNMTPAQMDKTLMMDEVIKK